VGNVTRLNGPPETIAQIIDEIGRIREGLFAVQRVLEKLEAVKMSYCWRFVQK
jgi:hypothetical protein